MDAREFWPISSGALGTASESEIQHLKAKGKGPGEFISVVERHLNGELDEETFFRFDTQDIEEDMNSALIAKAWVDAYYPLYTGTPAGKSKASPAGKPNTQAIPNAQEIEQSDAMGQAMSRSGAATAKKAFPPGNPLDPGLGAPQGPEQVITKDQLLRILADKGVLPEWMMNDERVMILDTTVHISKEGHNDDFTSYVWEKGVLKEKRLPPIVLNSTVQQANVGVDWARPGYDTTVVTTYDEKGLLYLKALEDKVYEDNRHITGKPIPEKEVTRGARVTAKTLRDELARWRKHPILSKYAPTEEEIKAKLDEIAA